MKKTYRNIMEHNRPDNSLISAAVERVEAEAVSRLERKKFFHKPLRIALACILVAALSVTAFAAGSRDFRETLFGPGSVLAGVLNPSEASAEREGLRVEVLGTVGDAHNFMVYYTLQDTKEQNRLSGDMSVKDFVQLNGEYPPAEEIRFHQEGMTQRTKVLDYDEETQTALCRLTMTVDEYNAMGARARLSLREISASQENREWFPYAKIDLEQADLTEETLSVVRGAVSADEEEQIVLKPGDGFTLPGLEFSPITAVGFADGRLHIQICRPAQEGYTPANVLEIQCADAGEGEAVAEALQNPPETLGTMDPDWYALRVYKEKDMITFCLDEEGRAVIPEDGREQYVEYVFDVTPETLSAFEFFGRGFSSDGSHIIPVDLSVDFTLNGRLPESMAFFSGVQVEDKTIETLEITPACVYLTGTRRDLSGIDSLELVSGDKTTEYRFVYAPCEFYQETDGSGDSVTVKYLTTDPLIEPTAVTALRIGDSEIPLTAQ